MSQKSTAGSNSANSAKLRNRVALVALCMLAGTLALFVGPIAFSATPTSGTVSEANPTVAWTGPVKPATGSASCGGPNNAACDNFRLNIVPPSPAFGPYIVEISLDPALAGDWDLQVYGPSGNQIGSSGNSPGQIEKVILNNPVAGTYTVSGAPFAPVVGPDLDGDMIPDSYGATAELKKQQTNPVPPGSEPISYGIHVAPTPLGRGAAEPSIGANHKSDNLMFISGLETLRIDFDDCSSPAKPTWTDVSFLTTSGIPTLDPILFTDSKTGRTFVSQLTGQDSRTAFTDDDGVSWLPSQGGGIPSGVDHQTLGGGRFHDPLARDPNGPLYPHAVYYCSQDIATAFCARSDNGGLTFGPGVPTWTLTECGGLHGPVKVAPTDGTVYVPNKGCDGQQAVVVSEDNGVTWNVRKVTGSSGGEWDPSVGVATDGTVYFAYGNGDGTPKVAVSKDRGLNWINTRDIGASVEADGHTGIRHTSFPVMVAGDPNRAAAAFLGSTEPTPGSGADDPNWPGNWYLFISHTYDGGLTWTTINATPSDPVQRGTIFSGGFTPEGAATRNLLDFIDSDVEREGRVVVAYADGCIGDCVKQRPNSFTEVATVARQVNGKRLFASFDQLTVPAAPLVEAKLDANNNSLVHLSWSAPDDHGSPITGYKIYRRTSDSAFSLRASVGSNVHSHDDTINSNLTYFYKVTATNALGEGPACGEVSPTVGQGGGEDENACEVPGVEVVSDPPGDDVAPNDPQLDIRSISFAGLLSDGTPRLVVTMKVGNLNPVPPNSSWRTVWTFNGINYFVGMNNCSLSGVTFSYGTFVAPSFTTVGAADAGTFSADGTITISIAASKIGNPAAGQALTAVNGITQTFVGAECSGLLLTQDSTANGSFTLASCVAGTPEARDDAATTQENNPVVINVVANDSDPNGDPLTVVGVTQGANGSVVNNGDGTVTYNPNANFNGSDSFTYTISDPGGLTDTATVRVTVNPFCPLQPTGRFFDDLEPTSEPGWQKDTVTNEAGPLSPTWQVVADPFAKSATNSFFSDATTLQKKDDRLLAPPQRLSSSSQLTFWQRFSFENTFDGGVLEVSTNGGSTWVDVLAGGGTFAQGGYNGLIAAGFGSPIAGRQAWTGNSEFIDAMSQVVINMGAFAGQEVRVRWRLASDPLVIGSLPGLGWWIDDIEFTNTLELSNCPRPPLANDDTANTTVNTPVTINVVANDTDPEGGPLTVTNVSDPPHGSVVNNIDGTVTYTPDPAFIGTDSFQYTIQDNQSLTDTAMVTVSVTQAPNKCPTAVNDSATTEKNEPVQISVLANDTDPDGDTLTVTGTSDPPNGNAVVNPNSTVTYTPDANFTGNDSFTYTITDGRGCSRTATVTVSVTAPVNHPPDAVDDMATTQENTAVTINVVANDTDSDSDSLTVTNVTDPPNGTATNNNGTVTYTPNAGFVGTDNFAYTISDGNGGSDTATVTVTVNRNPTAEGGKANGGGWVPSRTGNDKANFGFNVKGEAAAATGRLTFDSSKDGVSLKGTINSLQITGNQAKFTGTGTLGDGRNVRFTVHADDNGEPGTGADRFKIQIFDMTGAVLLYGTDSLLLGGGNIQVH